MLKKYYFVLLVLLGLVLAVVPVQANKKVQFTLASGIMWDQLFLWTLGLSVDLYLTKYLTITPEFYMANKEIGFKVSTDEDMGNYDPTYFLQPGVMLNYHHPSFFVGAGVVKSYQARSADFWKLKLNAGFKISHIRFTVFFLTNFEDLGWFPTATYNAYGAAIGYTL